MSGSYRLGVDLGTTFSAAAVLREGRESPEMVRVDGDPMVPSVVFLTEDGDELVGSVAAARAWDDPTRAAREFKRRFGDPVPIMVGGTSYSAARLDALVLARLAGEAATTEGGPASSITLTHPANWGPYKTELFAQVPDLAALTGTEVRFLTEPEAAAVSYASERPVRIGDRIAVYDLGGGTFDAAVVERTGDGGFEILGTPQGIEQLGGVDFDDVVLHHVQSALAGRFDGLDRADPGVTQGFAHLRADCRRAKELLSADTATTVRVNLPALLEQVRLTRGEFEALIRPTIAQTVTTLDAAIASAGIAAGDLSAVLLVGGSSRIPLVADMLTEHLGRPVVLDAHPKYATAQGAALHGPARPPAEATGATPTPTAAHPGPTPRTQPGVPPNAAAGAARPDAAATGVTGPPPSAHDPATPEPGERAEPTGGGGSGGLRVRRIAGVTLLVFLALAAAGYAMVGGNNEESQPPSGDSAGAGHREVTPVGVGAALGMTPNDENVVQLLDTDGQIVVAQARVDGPDTRSADLQVVDATTMEQRVPSIGAGWLTLHPVGDVIYGLDREPEQLSLSIVEPKVDGSATRAEELQVLPDREYDGLPALEHLDLTVELGQAWIVDGGSFLRLDLDSGAVTELSEGEDVTPGGLHGSEANMWVVDIGFETDTFHAVDDLEDGRLTDDAVGLITCEGDCQSAGAVADETGLWLFDPDVIGVRREGLVHVTSDGEVDVTVDTVRPRDVAVGRGSLWIAEGGSAFRFPVGRVVQVDPATGEVLADAVTCNRTDHIVATADGVFTLDEETMTLVKFDDDDLAPVEGVERLGDYIGLGEVC